MTERTPLQQVVHDIQVEIELEQRPRMAKCRTDDERKECIAAHAKIAWAKIDQVSQTHGMAPMLVRELRK